MPKFELELDDKGEFVGTVPAEINSLLEKNRVAALVEGKGKGYEKAVEEARAQIASTVAAEKAKWEAGLPAERAKWEGIDAENKLLRDQNQAAMANHRKALTEREEAHAQEITRRAERENKRDAKIRELVNQNLRALASKAGARDESLAELEVILQHRIGYSDDMVPFVKDEAGQPAKTTAGNPLPLDVFVKQYLDNHQHHRKADPKAGGGARGGATFHGHTGTATVESARQRVVDGDRSPDAINELFKAGRKTSAA